jgi:hypothetical protein
LGKCKAVSFGFGPIGQAIAKVALSRSEKIELVGVIDSNPELCGKDIGELLSLRKQGIKVRSSIEDLEGGDIVFHATSSFLDSTKNQLLDLCSRGYDIISTCEELSYPWYNHEEIAQELDAAAKKADVTMFAVGVNPGFVLDSLAITLSGVCERVDEIQGERILDSSLRRLPFQKKVGVGLDPKTFSENVESGKFGHIGLPESIAMVASALGKKVDRIEQKISPKLARKETSTEHFGVVKTGNVLGLVQDAVAYSSGRKIITYHLEMYDKAEDPHDQIEIIGTPKIKLRIPGGTPGDIATAAMVVNSVQRVLESNPGLFTVKDLKPASSVFSA